MSNLQNRSSFQSVKGQDALLAYQPIQYQPDTYVERNGLIYKSLSATSTTFIPQQWELIADLREVRVPNIASRNALTGMTATTGTTGIRIPILDNTNVLVLDAFSDPQVAVHEFARYNYNQTTGTWLLLQKGTGTTTTNVSNYQLLTNKPPVISGVTINVGNGLVGGGSVFGTNVSPFSAGGIITVSHADTSSQSNLNGSGYAYVQTLKVDTFGHVTGATLSTWIHPTGLTVNSNHTGYTYIQSIQVSNGHITGLGTSTWVHPDTSNQGSSNNSGNVFIQSIQLDTDGHVTGINTGVVPSGGGGGSALTYNGDFGGSMTVSSGGTLTFSGGTGIKTTRTGSPLNAGLRIDLVTGVAANQIFYSNGSNGLVGSPSLVFSGGTNTLRTTNFVLTNNFTLNTITTGSTSDQILTRNVSNGLVRELSVSTLGSAIAGAPINSVQYNNGNGFGGNNKWLFNPTSVALTLGVRSGSTGTNSVVLGYGRADGDYSFAGGSAYSGTSIYSIVAAGIGSFNYSTTTVSGAQSGTFASSSAILGGMDHYIKANNNYSVIVGGQTNKIPNISTNSYIFGGLNNIVSGGTIQLQNSGVFGGSSNQIIVNALASNFYLIGGSGNKITGGTNSIILGGGNNVLAASTGMILGGINHKMIGSTQTSTIIGGNTNTITGTSSSNTILGSTSSKINNGVNFAAIIGGTSITLTGSSQSSNVVVPNLMIWTNLVASTNNTNENILVRNPTTKKIVGSSSFMFNTTNNAFTVGTRLAGSSSGSGSIAFGQNVIASGSTTFAVGQNAYAAGQNSIAMGSGIFSSAYAVVAKGLGSINISYNTTDFTVPTGVLAQYSSIFGSVNSNISGSTNNKYHTIVGGTVHNIKGITQRSGLFGGQANTISGSSVTHVENNIFGGRGNNIVGGTDIDIVGGITNKVSLTTQNSLILGGLSNAITGGTRNAIIAGQTNTINSNGVNQSVILGGLSNRIAGVENNALILGGTNNFLSGATNPIPNSNGIILGSNNTLIANSTSNLILNGVSATINNSVGLSGSQNSIISASGTIINGQGNMIANGAGTITGSTIGTMIGSNGGTVGNSRNSIILGGGVGLSVASQNKIIQAFDSAIVGGGGNIINTLLFSSNKNVILGGDSHAITGNSSYNAIVGGHFNKINNGVSDSVILGGFSITLTGSSQNSNVVVPNLMIWNTPATATADKALTWNSNTKKVGLSTNLSSGTYTPTVTAVGNVASFTSYGGQWMRIGNVVSVGVRVDITVTVANSLSTIGISLPIPSVISFPHQLTGQIGANTTVSNSGVVYGDNTNSRANMNFLLNTTTNTSFFINFIYQVN